jgi:uncharacterized membrane protein
MKLILLLLAILIVPYLLLTGMSAAGIWASDPLWRGRVALALMLMFTGSAHFWGTQPMMRMLPPNVRGKAAIIYITGVLELMAASALSISKFTHLTGWCLIIFFVAIFPANIYAAVKRIDLAGQGRGPVYLLVRTPVQLFLIGWAWWFAAR